MTFYHQRKHACFWQHGRQWLLLPLLLITLCYGCKREPEIGVPNPTPSTYYWRTAWKLSPLEHNFINEHRIGKIYLRYFDVAMRDGTPRPVGTLTFEDSLPARLEYVPTVFIDEQCLHGNTEGLAENIVNRICQMTDTHDVPNVREIQLDCDYTANSRTAYYTLLKKVRTMLREKSLGLSVTIRLHQLSMPAPEADYGVLMVYNTGDFRQPGDRNPILDLHDARPYFKYLADYRLPLCAAYPTYEWALLFQENRFRALLYGANLNDSTLFRQTDEQTYEVIAAHDMYYGNADLHLVPGEKVIRYSCKTDDILSVKLAIANKRADIHRQIITFHLDSLNIKRYTYHEYEKIYHP